MTELASAAAPFPLAVDPSGAIVLATDPNLELRGRVIQVLFTSPGERVNLPEFGCGLFDLVFDPNDQILAAATEFVVGQALMRWLGEEIVVAGVSVAAADESLSIELAYTKRIDLTRQTVRVHFR